MANDQLTKEITSEITAGITLVPVLAIDRKAPGTATTNSSVNTSSCGSEDFVRNNPPEACSM